MIRLRETSAVKRPRRAPPISLEGKTIGLFDIGKTRTPEFLDQVEKRFNERGLKTKRFGKPTNAKVAHSRDCSRSRARSTSF